MRLAYVPVAVFFVAAAFWVTGTEGSAARPNIIFIMADDMGWGEPGSFPSTSAHGKIATPNLDRFAKEGMLFRHAYAGYTVCAPSRTALFTGRHSGQYKKANLSGTSLPPGQAITTSELLHNAGYKTALVGKSAPLTSPIQQGFDYFIGQVDQSFCHNMYPKSIDYGLGRGNVPLALNDQNPRSRDDCMANPDNYNYTVDITQTHSIKWLKETVEQQGGDPFFLYMSFTVPHAGGWGDPPSNPEQGAPVPTDGQYGNEPWPNVEKDHAGVIVYLDNYVGEIMATLRELSIDDDTIVFFASDNGAHLEGGHSVEFFNSTGGLKGHKRSLYEGGVRSPSMVRWPGKVAPNSESDLQWAFWDLMPTLCELGGCLDSVPSVTDGISIVPTLLGSGHQKTHEYMYFTWNGNKVYSKTHPKSGYSVRVGDWKGVVQHCNSTKNIPSVADTMELYDLSRDPFEVSNIAKGHQDVVERLKRLTISKDFSCDCYQC